MFLIWLVEFSIYMCVVAIASELPVMIVERDFRHPCIACKLTLTCYVPHTHTLTGHTPQGQATDAVK